MPSPPLDALPSREAGWGIQRAWWLVSGTLGAYAPLCFRQEWYRDPETVLAGQEGKVRVSTAGG